MSEVRRINRELKYSGSIVDIYTDTMEFPNGNTEKWDYIAHRKGAAAVLPVLDNGKLLMVRQYRNTLERQVLEIPAGCRDNVDEPTEECAARELEEETGYKAGKIEPLISLCAAVAYCYEMIDVYVATDLVKTKQSLDPNEFVELIECDLEDLVDKILKGEIVDAKTVAAVMAYKAKYNK